MFFKQGSLLFLFIYISITLQGQQTDNLHLLRNAYREVGPIVENIVIVPKDGKFTYVDIQGNPITNEYFDHCGVFKKGKAIVYRNGKYGVINKSGLLIAPMQYDYIMEYATHVTVARKNEDWFLLDSNGISIQKIDYKVSGLEFKKTEHKHESNEDIKIQSRIDFTCPPNIDFELGTFDNWQCLTGNTTVSGSSNIINLTASGPVVGRHELIPSTSTALDFYGKFPVVAPDASDFCVKLGNNIVGAQAEAVRYLIDVPSNVTDYSLVYQYAVVFQDPGHAPALQPRFAARLIDPATNQYLECGTFEYTAAGSIPGFQPSTVQAGVLYKPWTAVFLNLSKYFGRRVILEFVNADCTAGGHWGYSYLDVNDCSTVIRAVSSCTTPKKTVLSGPPGFQKYTWWDDQYKKIYANGQNATIQPELNLGTRLNLILVPFNNNCIDTLSVLVDSFSLSVALGPDKSICKGESVNIGIPPNKNYTYSWTGLSANTGTISVKPNVTTSYELAVSDKFSGCDAKSSIKVIVNNKPTIRLMPDTICLGNSTSLSPSGGDTYTWNTAPGLTTTTGNTVVVNPTTTTRYLVTGKSDATGCSDTASALVTVKPLPVLTFNSPTPCSGDTIEVRVSGASIYSWASAPSLISANGDKAKVVPLNTTSYNVTGTDTVLKCSSTGSFTVNVNPLPPTVIDNVAICIGQSATLTPKGADTYKWITAPGLASTSGSSIVVNPNTTASYIVTGTNLSTGCSSSDTATVTVNPLPNLILNAPAVCNGKNAVLNVSGANTYSWNPHPTLSTLTDSIVTVAPTTTTSYVVTGTFTSTGCQKTDSTKVTIYPLPTGGINIIGDNRFICDGSSVILEGIGGNTYQWYLNNDPIPGATFNKLEATKGGTYSLELTSPLGCKNFVTTRPAFELLKKPKAAFRSPVGCIGNLVSFTNLSQSNESGPVIYRWQLGDGSVATQFNPQHIYTQKGTYRPQLKVIPTLCPQLSDSVSGLVIIDAPVPGIRYPSVNALINTNTPLSARSIGVNYLWQPTVGLNNPQIANPVFNDDTENDYIIRITNSYGCVTYDSVKVRMFVVSDILVPTAFSPNSDGHNDRLDFFLIGIKEFNFFKVFNRWGQLVFETNDRMQLWDGRFKGKEQPLETYVWVAQGIGMDGKKITKRGQTVLIR
ncbi:MAG: gliding motility-associated C-terminal domain-containing protein [Bacteroidota bacterium]